MEKGWIGFVPGSPARAHAAQPDEFQAIALSAGVLKTLGREEEDRAAVAEALSLIERRLSLNPDDLRALSLGPGALIDAGRVDEGLAMAERAMALAPTDSSVIHNAMCAYAHAGETEKAIELLERRMEHAGTIYREWIEHDPDFDSVRDDPRFVAVMEKVPRHSDRA